MIRRKLVVMGCTVAFGAVSAIGALAVEMSVTAHSDSAPSPSAAVSADVAGSEIGLRSVNGPPRPPVVGELPSVPALPSITGTGGLPGVGGSPSIPGVNSLPTQPALPTVTSGIGVPTLPGLPVIPGANALPNLPALPLVSGTHGVPSLPALPAIRVVSELPGPADTAHLPVVGGLPIPPLPALPLGAVTSPTGTGSAASAVPSLGCVLSIFKHC